MRILITGANGFVGHHLAQHIRSKFPEAHIHGTVLHADEPKPAFVDTHFAIDLREKSQVDNLIATINPDQIYHLAAQSFVPASFQDPWDTLENNIKCQLNLIEACLDQDLQPRFLVVSSSETYGHAEPGEFPLTETTPLRPNNPYSVSKLAQDMLGLQFFLSHQFPVIRVRPFNHIGPGQSERFVATAFAMQIARIEVGLQEPILHVGNLSAKRDFTDVRDVVQAYTALIERGKLGEVYNIASNKAHSVQYLLDTLLGHSEHKIEVEVDPARFRPIEVPLVIGDASKLYRDTGWKPGIPFEQTALDILHDCRERVQQS